MLWTIAIIVVILWAVGLLSAVTLGGYHHLLIGLAALVMIVALLRGRRRVRG